MKQKKNNKTTTLVIRATPEYKEKVIIEAKELSMSTSAYITKAINKILPKK